MIETVTFKNFKALRELSMPLTRFTLLVGPNGSGKTSVLQGLAYLYFLNYADAGFFRGNRALSELLSRGATTGGLGIRCRGTWAQKPGAIDLSLSEYDPERFTWKLKVTHGERSYVLDETNYQPAPVDVDGVPLEDLSPPIGLLRLEADGIAQPAYSGALRPRMEPDGSGTAAVLADMALSRPEDFRSVEEGLRAVIPSVEQIRLERALVRRSELQRITVDNRTTESTVEREYVGHKVVFDMQGAPNVSATAASEGTLVMLGILTAILGHRGHNLVLIDDLERGIHPRAIADLVAQIRRLLDVFPDLQIVATSHSPYLVDLLDPAEVRLMLADGAGARWARLDDHPEFERWREFMRPGEIWSMIGEDWIGVQGARSNG